ncbi:thermonuclease family protein [Bacillus sp. JJ1609]|uniref:thermonuclease family protein n=1 Tax=Bacillus sp. JJ1609 TaxID=3122977 RepID=UPI003000E08E
MKRIKYYIFATFIILAYLFLPGMASAHNGGLDELGGHFRSADCVYLLHEPTKIAKSASNMEDLIKLIKQYNSNACAQDLNESKVELDGYIFPKAGNTVHNSEQNASNSTASPSKGIPQLGKTYAAKLVDCIDGDTAVFNVNGKEYKTRFLYIDSPESTTSLEPFGPEAAEFTCSFLKQGKITLETDGRNLFDKYGRLLAWVWVGDKLHQEEITKAGLVEDFYDYGNYKYENRIWAAMDYAKSNHKGLYASSKPRKEENQYDQPDDQTMKNPEQSEKEAKKTEEKGDEKEGKGKSVQTSEGSESEEKGLRGWGFLAVLMIALLFYFIRKGR